MIRRSVLLSGVLLAALVVPPYAIGPVVAGPTAPGRADAGPLAADPGPAAVDGGGTGRFVLTATNRGSSYAPTFTGNGYLGVRVPPDGQGYAGGSVPSQSEVAGFYARPPGRDEIQQRASVPTWSTLRFAAGGQTFSLDSGSVTGWRQQIDLHTGVITTSARWKAPNGRVTDLRYDVFTDRARPYVAAVRLQVTPQWNGDASVTDLIDGKPATLTTGLHKGWNLSDHQVWETVRTVGTGLVGGLASRVAVQPASAAVGDRAVARSAPQSVGQRLGLAVHRGHTYTVTKYVGVVTSQVTRDPSSYAREQADVAASLDYSALLGENTDSWSRLWSGRIDIRGTEQLATEVNASQFYLWSNTRKGVDWSISPAGLSSNGYAGHIFWDAETWMYPSLLAQHPELAAGANAYRYQRLKEAEAHARDTGYTGARYPWESALDGTEQIPPPVSVNSEGLYEQHITSDIALAQWQYYLVTGDRGWLRSRGWPVLSQAAMFWASRVVKGPDGGYHIRHVTGPDEENPNVNDEVYTNVAAATALRDATLAARVLGEHAPAAWERIADGLVVGFDPGRGLHPEFTGYRGQPVKQADVTMLQYPWRLKMPSKVAARDLGYYVPRTDPHGPSMTDAISTIDTAALGSAGCASYVYTQRSVDPFMRDVFDQFSETSLGGAFTFTTGIGGFLQEFLYGYSGLRWDNQAVQLDPSLTSQLEGVTLHDLQWRGRVFTIAVGPKTTRVALQSGAPLPVDVRGDLHSVPVGSPLAVPTRRPDLTPTADLARCRPASASSAQSLGPPLAAVDGSKATFWQPEKLPATLTVPLSSTQRINQVVLRWGQRWAPPPASGQPPPAHPVVTLRASSYDVLASVDGHIWKTVARVRGRTTGRHDIIGLPTTTARYVKLRIYQGTYHSPPKLQELSVSGP